MIKAEYQNRHEPSIYFEVHSMLARLTIDEAKQLRDALTDAIRTPRCVDCDEAMPEDSDWPMVAATDDSCCEDWCCWHCHGLRMRTEAVQAGRI